MNKLISAAALFILAPANAFAQTYEKNNLPCIAELCIGDDLAALAKVPWDRARTAITIGGKPNYVGQYPVTENAMKELTRTYRGAVAPAAPYLSIRAFDQKAFPLLARVTASCERTELQGMFTTQSGNPTTVTIALIPDKEDVSVQRWTVVQIGRKFPAAVSYQQRSEIEQQLKERYGRFGRMERPRKTDGHFEMGSLIFGFFLSLSPSSGEMERRKLHPECGGAKKLSID